MSDQYHRDATSLIGDAPGLYYHVYSRGIRRLPIFQDDIDRAMFLEQIERATKRDDLAVLSFALITNHFHLFVRTAARPLSLTMHSILRAYAWLWNRRHDGSGHLFEDEFGRKRCRSDQHLLEVARYVNLNPILAGLHRWNEPYAWSSLAPIVSGRMEAILDREALLSLFGSSRKPAVAAFRKHLRDGLTRLRSRLESHVWGPLDGVEDEAAIESAEDRPASGDGLDGSSADDECGPDHGRAFEDGAAWRTETEQVALLKRLASVLETEHRLPGGSIRGPSRLRRVSAARAATAWVAVQLLGIRPKVIWTVLGRTSGAVAQLVSAHERCAASHGGTETERLRQLAVRATSDAQTLPTA